MADVGASTRLIKKYFVHIYQCRETKNNKDKERRQGNVVYGKDRKSLSAIFWPLRSGNPQLPNLETNIIIIDNLCLNTAMTTDHRSVLCDRTDYHQPCILSTSGPYTLPELLEAETHGEMQLPKTACHHVTSLLLHSLSVCLFFFPFIIYSFYISDGHYYCFFKKIRECVHVLFFYIVVNHWKQELSLF